MLIDLHAHTRPISWDSDLTPDELVESAKAAGLDGICLTEHDYFWEPAEARALAERHSFLVLPAVELNTENGHILVYGLDEYEYGMHIIGRLAAMVEAADGVMIAAHPYRRYMPWHHLDEKDLPPAMERAARNPAYRRCVALETRHGRANRQQNAFSEMLSDLLDLPGTGGSDSHQRDHVGRCATLFQREVRDIRDLIGELKAGRFQAVDRRDGAAR